MKDGKYEIKLMNKIAAIGTDRFDANKFVCSDAAEAPEGILVRSADMLNYDICINTTGKDIKQLVEDFAETIK